MTWLRLILAVALAAPATAPAPATAQPDTTGPPPPDAPSEHAPAAPTDAIPTAFGIERYSFIWEKSPFTLPSAAEEPAMADFAANYSLVGQGFIGGKPFARILDKASQERFTITVGEPAHGIELVALEPADDPLESAARVRKGTETGILRFDPALLSAAAGAPPNMPVPQQGIPGQPPNIQQPGQPPSPTNIPTPRRRRIIIPSSR